jgi:hypothetical protein
MVCAAYQPDDNTGKVIYGYVTDKCPDANYWCKSDTWHLDIRKSALGGMANGWNGRKISWDYVSSAPGCASVPEFSVISQKDEFRDVPPKPC